MPGRTGTSPNQVTPEGEPRSFATSRDVGIWCTTVTRDKPVKSTLESVATELPPSPASSSPPLGPDQSLNKAKCTRNDCAKSFGDFRWQHQNCKGTKRRGWKRYADWASDLSRDLKIYDHWEKDLNASFIGFRTRNEK